MLIIFQGTSPHSAQMHETSNSNVQYFFNPQVACKECQFAPHFTAILKKPYKLTTNPFVQELFNRAY